MTIFVETRAALTVRAAFDTASKRTASTHTILRRIA